MRHFGSAIAKASVLAAALAWASAPGAHGAPQSAPKYLSVALPPAMQSLAAKIQGQKPDAARQIIVRQLGLPTRDVGSGLSIPQWDVSGGVLTFSDISGPTFRRAGHTFWLIKTRNLLRPNLLGSYQMGSKFGWLGELKIGPSMAYRYTENSHSPGDFPPIMRHTKYFFRQHPSGHVGIFLPSHLKATTLLETVHGRAVIARVVFISSDGARRTFSIVSDADGRSLSFSGSARNFEMGKSWDNFWS